MSTTEPHPSRRRGDLRARLATLLAASSRAESRFELSAAQLRFWFFEQMQPGSPLYHLPAAVRLRGPLDLEVFARAFTEVQRRHESLRTVFPTTEGVPQQYVLPSAPVRIPTVDLRSLPPTEREARVLQLSREEAVRPFDLTAGPLFRARLLQLENEEHVLLLTMHHIVSDGWSVGVAIREVSEIYTELRRGYASPLRPLPLQYPDFSTWQRAQLKEGRWDHQLAFWRRELQGVPDRLALPLDFPRPAEPKFRGESVPVEIPAEVTKALGDAARSVGGTLFMALLAIFQTLLRRYARQEQFLVGTPIAGRTRAELEPLIGCFVNTLALRADFRGDPTFAELLARVRDITLKAYAHQDIPFEHVVESLDLPRDPRRSPLFQNMFVFQNTPRLFWNLPELEIEWIEIPLDRALFDLTLALSPKSEGISGELQFNRDILTRDSAEGMGRSFSQLCRAVVSGMDTPASRLPLCDAPCQASLLSASHGPPQLESPPLALAAFQEWALKEPDLPAVRDSAGTVSYGELAALSERLAASLRRYELPPGELVAVALPRSRELVALLLAVWKVNCPFLPVDPAYPVKRMEQMLALARPGMVVTGASEVELPAALAGTQIVCYEELLASSVAAVGEKADTSRYAEPRDPAYTIFTSGSSGVPKGVVVSHGALGHFLCAYREQLPFTPEDRVLLFMSVNFDASLGELFAALTSGAALCLLDPGPFDFARLANCLREHRVTHAAFAASLLQALPPESYPALRRILAGGEVVEQHVVDAWAGEREFWNIYGPTEATIAVTLGRCEPSGLPLLGRPLRGVRAYLLDEYLVPVPDGMVGELYLAGPTLADGYCRAPAATAERFIPEPFSGVAGARMYRTGDLARRGATGLLEFRGRADRQLKLRGHRIEPAEIELALCAIPGVAEAIVYCEEQEPLRLLAAVTPVAGASLQAPAVRQQLQSVLPDYLVPAVLYVLPSLPREAGGKLDRRALVSLAVDRSAGTETMVAPRDEVERRLAEIFAQVLGLPAVGVFDNFFSLGGDSILAIQVVARAAAQGDHFTALQLFQQQNVAGLARVARAAPMIIADQGPVDGPTLPLPAMQWYSELGLPRPEYFNQALLWELRVRPETDALNAAVRAVVRHHDGLRLRADLRDGTWEWRIAPADAEPPSFERFDFGHVPTEQVACRLAEACEQVQGSFNLEQGPIFRVVYFDCGTHRPGRLLLAAHHAAIDGVSWRILQQDLFAAYRQAAAGEPIVLPPKTTSIRAWAEHLVDWAQSDAGMEAAAQWRKRLADFPAAPELPSVLREATQDGHDASLTLREELTHETGARLSLHGRRLLAILLTTLARAWGRRTGADALSLVIEQHGREPFSPNLSADRTIGWFTAFVPMLLVADEGSLEAAVRETEQELETIPHGASSLGVLRYGATEREGILGEVPQLQICFNHLGRLDADFAEASEFLSRAEESAGREVADENPAPYPILVTTALLGGNLHVALSIDPRRVSVREAKGLLAEWLEQLNGAAEELTPSLGEIGGVAITPPEHDRRQLAERYPGAELVYPLTPAQEGLLYHARHEREGDVYVSQLSCKLTGLLNPEEFRLAWGEVIARHPPLRTAFSSHGLTRPWQVVMPPMEAPLRYETWDLPDPEQAEATFQAMLLERRAEGLDPSKAPLLRLDLIRTGEWEHRFLLTTHHLLLDGWSFGPLLHEVLTIYRARCGGFAPSLPPRRPFGDYLAWLSRQDRAAAVAWWRTAMRELSSPTLLHEAMPDSPRRGQSAPAEIEELDFRLNAELTRELNRLARQGATTLATVLHAAWGFLLARHCGRERVVFGTVVSGRPPELAGVEQMLGMLVNTLAVPLEVPDSLTLQEWLRQVGTHLAEMREFEYVPLVDALAASRLPRTEAPFDTLLVVENYPIDHSLLHMNDGEFTVGEVRARERSHYPLSVVVTPADELHVRLAYSAAWFTRESIERVFQRFQVVLREFVRQPTGKLSHFEWLTWEERSGLATRFSDSQPADSIPQRGEELVAQRALGNLRQAIALAWRDGEMSYVQIHQLSERLMLQLQARTRGAPVVVGVMLPRGPAWVVAMLAVMKCGAIYLPLDPAYPKERLRLIMDEGIPALVVTESRWLDWLDAHGIPWLCVDDQGELKVLPTPEGLPHHDLLDVVSSAVSDPAYLLFTSGSTGTPKGTLCRHASLVNMARALAEAYELTCHDRVLQFASTGFDASLAEVFAAFAAGAAVYFVAESERSDPVALAAALDEGGVTVATLPPSVLREIDVDLPRLRLMVSAGEACPGDVAQRWAARGRLVNGYGPTETTVCVTMGEASAESPAAPPIGHLIPGARGYVLDQRLKPVPYGVAGELYIAGTPVGFGYWRRPKETAARFLPDLFSNTPGGRMFRTGDWVRQRADGELEYLGRRDRQFKIRGHRIEAAEVEAVLRSSPDVHDVVVDARLDAKGELQLCAWVQSTEKRDLNSAALRAHAARALSAPAIPSRFVGIDQIPLTPNGKVDRRALSIEDLEEAGVPRSAEPPHGEMEELVAAVWREVLQVNFVGRDDDFFELGGHSLAAARVASLLGGQLDRPIPIQLVFLHPSIAGLAAAIDSSTELSEVESLDSRLPVAELAARAAVYTMFAPSREIPYNPSPRSLLVTGATGFLGAWLLDRALHADFEEVHCLVRAASPEIARERLSANLQRYGLPAGERLRRVGVWCGDVGTPGLGLASREYTELTERLEAVIHSASDVNFVYPYSRLERPNVVGTQQVLMLAREARATLHHVSTLSVFGQADEEPKPSAAWSEHAQLESMGILAGGYSQTKWAAEWLVRRAVEEGLPTTVYRPGRLTGDSRTGAANTGDLFYRILQACVELESVPAVPMPLDMTPVDYVADALFALVRQTRSRGCTFHLFNRRSPTLLELAEALRGRGYRVEPVDVIEFAERLHRAISAGRLRDLEPLAPLLARPTSDSESLAAMQFDDTFTRSRLAVAGVECPPIDAAILERYFSFLERSGFLVPPRRTR